jgi:hypothetical protein
LPVRTTTALDAGRAESAAGAAEDRDITPYAGATRTLGA